MQGLYNKTDDIYLTDEYQKFTGKSGDEWLIFLIWNIMLSGDYYCYV